MSIFAQNTRAETSPMTVPCRWDAACCLPVAWVGAALPVRRKGAIGARSICCMGTAPALGWHCVSCPPPPQSAVPLAVGRFACSVGSCSSGVAGWVWLESETMFRFLEIKSSSIGSCPKKERLHRHFVTVCAVQHRVWCWTKCWSLLF